MKKVSLLISFIVFSLFIITSCNNGKNTKTGEDNDTLNNKENVEEVDNRFHSESGNFKINFISEPTESKETVVTDMGEIKMATYMVESDGLIYALVYSDYPAEEIAAQTPEALLKKGQASFISSLGIEITKEEINELSGVPGLYFEAQGTIDDLSYFVTTQDYLKDNRFYQIAIMRDDRMATQEEIDAFIGTFEIVE